MKSLMPPELCELIHIVDLDFHLICQGSLVATKSYYIRMLVCMCVHVCVCAHVQMCACIWHKITLSLILQRLNLVFIRVFLSPGTH